ncbi:MAG: UbiA family prenyltransferase, partial [Chloroflexi bacterium]|nr:UbiA family prenyltransferase [Chloroflexota bacterium]
MGSAGANGLTNYLDREVDARMKRTCARALPSRTIEPARKVLPLIVLLILGGLILVWTIYPLCFFIGLTGIIASGVWRKTISCTFLGIVAGSAPVLIGWYAITKQPVIDIQVILFFCLIAIWTPLHVWTLMLANRSDYEAAGLRYFPLSWQDKDVIKLLAVLSVALYAVSLSIYFFTGLYGWLYLIVASMLGLLMIYANIQLLVSPTSKNAWKV